MSAQELELLLSTQTIRSRAEQIFQFAQNGKTHFSVNLDNLDKTVDFVIRITREQYPNLDMSFHSRWKHFQVGGIDRVGLLNQKLHHHSSDERVRAKIDLAIVSVLLDAGSGQKWFYKEPSTGKTFSRSEGLAVASYDMFINGLFSSNPKNPYQVDSIALGRLSKDAFYKAFQHSDENPLDGIAGRLSLMHALAKAVSQSLEYIDAMDGTGHMNPRPGNILDKLKHLADHGKIRAENILRVLQIQYGSIWPGRQFLDGFNLGDVWKYRPLGEGINGLVPFHKLSQWLTYSLVEPLTESALTVTHFEDLTALAEYRNGGLLVDMELIQLRDPSLAAKAHRADSELIIEWRALTVVLIEKIADLIRKKLKKSKEELPLGKILEGGTWAAGRTIAAEKRKDGAPPIKIISDGTVF